MLFDGLKYIIFNTIRPIIYLRYKIKVKGLENINSKTCSRLGGILFLPNHPAEVDPVILGSILWPRFKPRPMIVDWIMKLPIVAVIMKLMRAVSIPNFEDKSSPDKRLQAEESFNQVVRGLKEKDNFMVYPAGRLKMTEQESLGGASGVYKIIQANPDINVVLVRTTGLWGSRFSRGWDGKKVIFIDAVLHAFWTIIKNGIFFVPKRKVLVEFELANESFPFYGSRFELNRYLENWYNQRRDPLHLVPYTIFSNRVRHPHNFENPVIDIDKVPENIRLDVQAEIARIAKCLYSEIKPQMNLFSDLKLDSLDIQDLATFLEVRYHVKKIQPCQLTTVASVMNYAAQPDEPIVTSTEKILSSVEWKNYFQKEMIRATILEETIPKAFLKLATSRKKDLICADMIVGEMSYQKMMIAVILLSKKIQKMPGEYIGILLPASVTVNILIMACQVAKKIPVMINWTVGKNHLEAVLKLTNLSTVLTSRAFIKNIEDTDISPIHSHLIYMEEIRKEITLLDKLKGYCLSQFGYSSLVKKLKLDQIDKNKTAVLIFTSGTETTPKGVPLSHENIIADLNAAFDRVETSNHDVILGFLPPFHSYGLTVTGLLPLISGVRVVYYPNPTHYKKMGRLIAQWHVSFLSGAPTFLKGILQPSHKEFFQSLRIVVSGAEKAPESLLNRIEEVCPHVEFLEGYGLSECAPILTLNVPKEPHQGVGPALDIVELLLVNPDTNEPVPMGEKGHVLACGKNIFAGYIGNFASPFIELNGKKWFKTGDLGYLDSRGYLTLVGRLKRQVKIGGEIVNLNALEEGLIHALTLDGHITAKQDDSPTLAVCAKESDSRAQLYLFVTFDIELDEVNKKIKKLGFSNLYRVNVIKKLEKLPIMASGKIHYRLLEESV